MNASRHLSLLAAIVLSLSAGCSGCDGGGDDPPPPPPAGSCTDGVKNGTETGVDCGGGCATGCADGVACLAVADCASSYCNPNNVCSTPSCTDLWQNGTETGLNCGGATCVAEGKTCGDGLACGADADCTGGYCNASDICGTATCTDGALNGLETAQDCGGATCVAQGYLCANDAACTVDADCANGYCNAGNLCKTPTCADGVKNGAETGLDCGGAQCTFEQKTCADGLGCAVGTDCASSYCAPTLVCATPTCGDAWVNGKETGLNCGGGTCPDCANGLGCAVDGDCTSGFCNLSTHLCAAPTCGDGWRNGTETDVDCGGTCTAKCAAGFDCLGTSDCVSPLVCDPTTKVCATQCLANPTACTSNEQCCTGFCDLSVPGSEACADPVTCTGNGQGCAFNSDCCTNYCDPSKVCGNPPACRALDVACSVNGDCCDQYCSPSTRLCAVPVSSCEAAGSNCASGGECCSTACNTTTNACTSTAFCKVAGSACVNSGECCSVNCQGGVCLDTVCKSTGATCTAGTECCTGTCTSNLCAAIPAPSGTSACATLGDTCDPAADTCCSKNCQGGKCTPAFTCHAPSDLCYRNEDCCSGKCTTTSPTVPGRCLAPTGGDIQGGAPCEGPTTCVTRICADLGSGQTVCKPAGGCKMTGDYCNPNQYSTTTACTSANYRTVCWPLYGDNATCDAGFCTNPNGACCGGTPDKVDPSGYGVECAPKQVGAPTLCSNGQSCNPPGNICGAAGDNASQNCCAGQKEVCKRDLNGIARCFGGGSTTCPTGYDGANPACCIGTDPGTSGVDNVCQFRDQCCNFAPCVPDDNGVLRCTLSTCTELHGACTGSDDGSCCAGTVCTLDSGDLYPSEYTCEVPTACTSNGNACAFNSDCCSSNCSGGFCAPPCAGAGASCTVGDCCAGLDCDIPAGDTSGVCVSVSSCAPTNGACNVSADCCNSPTEECIDGACAEPASCLPQFTSCTAATAATCCAPTGCIEQNGTDCLAGSTTCSCDTCAAEEGACDPSAADTGCCVGLNCIGTGTTGTCQSCVLAGSTCANSAQCCPSTSGPTFVCAELETGEACTGVNCTCATCLLKDQPCTAAGLGCCGNGFCGAWDGFNYNGCTAADPDCVCVYTGG